MKSKKNKQKGEGVSLRSYRLKVYMSQELGDLYSEQKVAGAIFGLPHTPSRTTSVIYHCQNRATAETVKAVGQL